MQDVVGAQQQRLRYCHAKRFRPVTLIIAVERRLLAGRYMVNQQARAAILVVDDDPSLLDVLRFLLETETYAVTTASDGSSALQLLTAHRFDYVLSDYMMPGLDGAGLYEALRARGDTTCFILMTSLPLERVRALCPMCNGYLQKPFTIDTLLAQLK